jgi:hypothetical protein
MYSDTSLSKSNNNLRLIPPSSQRDGANNSNTRQNEDELEHSGTRMKRVLSNLSISIRSWTNKDKDTYDSSRDRRPNSRNPTGTSTIKHVSEEKRDENRLYTSLEDAGRIADGVCAVEVWILDRTSKNQGAVMLVQPPGGLWCCPDFIPDDYDALSRIEDKERADYEHAHPLLPGTGLGGTLWNERLHSVEDGNGKKRRNADLGTIQKRKRAMARMLKSKPQLPIYTPMPKSFQSMTNLHANYDSYRSTVAAQAMNSETMSTDGFTWRHIESVLADPYQPTFRRLTLMEEAGFSKCAGIHFDIQGTEGILLFFANEEIPTSRLNTADNVDCMRAATSLVGSAAAMSLHRIRLSARLSSSLVPNTNTNLKTGHHIYNNFTTYIAKLRGGDLQPPTSMPLDEALLTFIGVFLTLLTLHCASGWIEETTGSGFILAPFGALMTLQFGLTMAPVGQPRNIIFGQTIATIIGLLFLSIPESQLHKYLRISLATATAIAAMVKLGVTHPPAGASVLVISSGGYGWNILPPVLLSNLIAIVMSTLVNNLSEKRQYPTFFHLGEKFLSGALFGCCSQEGDLSFIIHESVKSNRASSILKEANFLNNDGQKRETGIRRKRLSSKDLSISSGVPTYRSMSVTAVEDDGIGLDIFANEATTFLNPPSTRCEKNLDATSLNQNEAILIDKGSPSENLTSKIPSRHVQLARLSTLEEVEKSNPSTRSSEKQTKPPQMHYGSMFMVPMSLRQDVEREEVDMDDGGASQESSDLEDMMF